MYVSHYRLIQNEINLKVGNESIAINPFPQTAFCLYSLTLIFKYYKDHSFTIFSFKVFLGDYDGKGAHTQNHK